MGLTAWKLRNLDEASALIAEAMCLFRDTGYRWGVISCLEVVGFLSEAKGLSERAARLCGTAQALITARYSWITGNREDHDRIVAATRAALGRERFEEL